MAVLAWEGYKLTMLNRERLFGDSGLSYAYVTIAVPVGCILLTLAISPMRAKPGANRTAGSLIFTRTMATPNSARRSDHGS
jgi:hypothetical protein